MRNGRRVIYNGGAGERVVYCMPLAQAEMQRQPGKESIYRINDMLFRAHPFSSGRTGFRDYPIRW